MAAKAQLAPNDPDVRIPAAVKAASERADQIHAQLVNPKPDPAPPAEPPGEPATPPPDQPAPNEPPTPPEPTPELAEKVTPPGNPPVDPWENRYNSMKGRFEQSQRLASEQAARISNLERVVSTLQKPPAPETEVLITPEEEKDYGPEFLDVVSRRAKQAFAPVETALRAQITELQARLGDVGASVATDARSRMISALDEQCSSWKELNTKKEFLEWLQLPDPYSGAIRHELLKAAFDRNETARVLAFFNGFLAEEAAVAPVDPGPDLQPPATPPSPAAPKVPLVDLAAPGRAKSAAGQAPPSEKPIITRAQIASFYSDVAAGKYRGKDEEKNRLEKMIFDADRDKRIR